MDILQIKVLNGPNYWSNYWKQLIVIKLDLKKYEQLPTDLLKGFHKSLSKLIPSLKSHYCSRNHEGGFLERVKEGTWLGHVIEHVALELQTLAGMDCSYGRTRPTGKTGVYNVVFSYEVANAGIYAGKTALKVVETLARGKTYNNLKKDIEHLKRIQNHEGYGISTKALVEEAQKRHIPITPLDHNSLIMLGYGCHHKLISAALSSNTSCLGVDITSDKNQTKQILNAAYIPVPQGIVISKATQLEEALQQLEFPLVVKPLDGNHGRGITTHIFSLEQAQLAFKNAQKVSNRVIVEHFIKGDDYRFLVVNYKLIAVAKRIPAFVIGDGISSIRKLIELTNKDPKRGDDHENVLTTIKIDSVTKSILKAAHLTLDSILPKGKLLYVKHAANLSSGGTAVEVSDTVHPHNRLLAERIARLLHLDICGIDIVAETVEHPINAENGAVIEVNAAPGLRMHLSPSHGKSVNVAKDIMDMLFPETKEARIPMIAVTGTNGKTTTVRLLSHFAMRAGKSVGYTTTDGIYLNEEQMFYGDCSGPTSARAVLSDSAVDFAVLECARGGIVRSGLGFDQCNIGILLNVSSDHLGLGGIETLEELAKVKSVVLHSVKKDGYAILNAEDDLVYSFKTELKCNVALFSLDPLNPRVIEHYNNGGIAAYIENNELVFHADNRKHRVISILDIPLSNAGKATCMLQNILAATLGGILSGFAIENIADWLKIFDARNIPGRMNLFHIGHLKVLLDYAHNVDAYQNLEKYLSQIESPKKIGIIGIPGDRRENDIRDLGFHAAKIFDSIIIRHDKDGRGRSDVEITHLLTEGIHRHNSRLPISVISDDFEALDWVLKNSPEDSFIVYCPEKIFDAIQFLKQLEDQ